MFSCTQSGGRGSLAHKCATRSSRSSIRPLSAVLPQCICSILRWEPPCRNGNGNGNGNGVGNGDGNRVGDASCFLAFGSGFDAAVSVRALVGSDHRPEAGGPQVEESTAEGRDSVVI